MRTPSILFGGHLHHDDAVRSRIVFQKTKLEPQIHERNDLSPEVDHPLDEVRVLGTSVISIMR
jgi:hypothetical protein